jgi:hypothetical protein
MDEKELVYTGSDQPDLSLCTCIHWFIFYFTWCHNLLGVDRCVKRVPPRFPATNEDFFLSRKQKIHVMRKKIMCKLADKG